MLATVCIAEREICFGPSRFLIDSLAMTRGNKAAVAAAGFTALAASSQFSTFAVPRAADVSAPASLRSAASTRSQAQASQGGVLGVTSVACAAAGFAASRRRGVGSSADTRAKDSRVACAAVGGQKRCLVMGGTRFIGCYLVAKLREQGYEVVASQSLLARWVFLTL